MGCFTDRLDRIERKLDLILKGDRNIIRKERLIMATLDQIALEVAGESTDIDSLAKLFAGIQQQLADVLSGANLPPAVQAKVDAIFAAVEANKQKLADALAANVPPPTP